MTKEDDQLYRRDPQTGEFVPVDPDLGEPATGTDDAPTGEMRQLADSPFPSGSPIPTPMQEDVAEEPARRIVSRRRGVGWWSKRIALGFVLLLIALGVLGATISHFNSTNADATQRTTPTVTNTAK